MLVKRNDISFTHIKTLKKRKLIMASQCRPISCSAESVFQRNQLADSLQQIPELQSAKHDQMDLESHPLFGQVELTEVIFTQIFSLLAVHDLARLRTVSTEVTTLSKEYILYYLKNYSLMRIVADYGFEPASDLRNLIIIQKAYEACLCEEGNKGLNLNTLHDRFISVEDRNLIKLFLRYMNTVINTGKITFLKNNPAEEAFLQDHPELNVCCISQVDDIPEAAKTIRVWLKAQQSIELSVLHLGKLPAPHNTNMCIIPAEIGFFRLKILLANNNSFRLISRNVSEAVIQRIDLRDNQLGALPDELGSRSNQTAYSTEGNPKRMISPKESPQTTLINRNIHHYYQLGAKIQTTMLPSAVKASNGKSCDP